MGSEMCIRDRLQVGNVLEKPSNQSSMPVQTGFYFTFYLDGVLLEVVGELWIGGAELLRRSIYDAALALQALDEGF